MTGETRVRRGRVRPLLATLLLAACAVTCRKALTNPADPESPTYPGEPTRVDPGPDLASSIGDTLVFFGSFIGDTARVAEYAWDFDGDGTFDWRGGSVAVPHAYRATGVYSARFQVRGIVGDVESATARVTVTDEAPAGGIGPDTLVVPGDEFVLVPRVTDDGRVVRFEWDLDGDSDPDSILSTGAPLFLSYPDPGDHVVSLLAVDDDGHTARFARRVRACPLPAPPQPLALADSALDVPTRLVLTWTSSSDCASHLTYDVYLDTTDTATRLVEAGTEVAAHYTDILPHATRFWWRVVAKDSGGRQQSSPIFTFTTRGIPFAMVFFEPANAPIGSTRSPNESPPHDAYLDGYYIDERETTRYEFTAFVNATGYVPEGTFDRNYPVGTEDFPATDVTWADAAAYAAWRGKRLPTEAEWEYAGRGQHDAVFPWGNRIVIHLCTYANVATTPGVYCVGATTRTLSYPRGKSLSGVYDLAGNAAEWVADWYDSTYYSDPLSRMLPTGPVTGTTKVVRGGSWASYYLEYSLTHRAALPPSTANDQVGFRCALSIEAPTPTPPPP